MHSKTSGRRRKGGDEAAQRMREQDCSAGQGAPSILLLCVCQALRPDISNHVNGDETEWGNRLHPLQRGVRISMTVAPSEGLNIGIAQVGGEGSSVKWVPGVGVAGKNQGL